ncbi:WD repeat-containing protein 73-like isoform X1 [Schistocerca nitens]|uniref:WD repeat-containing protein 73-like isoform X1 n=2 Tax=Schistocerca nitens TaxID=7011 RepID=UPI0021181D70|nr:WD repeat-containing protein 73-like isoform X1 [Schistocerca nitens]
MDAGRELREEELGISEEEDDDDWFYDSIKRYSVLQMFKFETPKYRLFLSGEKRICVFGKDRRGNDEVMELMLPKSLTELPDQARLEKNDLKQISGGFTSAPLVDMRVLYGKKKFVASQKALNGIVMYQMGSEKSDYISILQTIKCSQFEPFMAINNEDKLALVTTNRKGITWIDLTVGKSVGTTGLSPCTGEESTVKAEFVSRNIIAVCSENEGSASLYDTRTGSTDGHLTCDHKTAGGQWVLSSNYNCERGSESENQEYVGLLSNTGNITIFDIRNNRAALCNDNVFNNRKIRTSVCNSQIHLRFSTISVNSISVSGFDDNIYVYELLKTGGLSLRFMHDGHRKTSVRKRFNTTDHLWYGKIILSASEDKSLHCWQFS